MFNKKRYLAIIPARSGSKRLQGKNLLNLSGKPLISWTIEAACRCKYLDEVMVTTDDEEISVIAKKYGAKVPFRRPEHLASDEATTIDVVKHVIKYYEDEVNMHFDFIVLLQPTSPLRSDNDITSAVELQYEKKADAVVSVCEAEHSPLWTNTIASDGDMSDFIQHDIGKVRSQDLPVYYRLNGAIYICSVNRFLREETFFINDNIFSYIMSAKSSVDIDNQIDFDFARFLLSK